MSDTTLPRQIRRAAADVERQATVIMNTPDESILYEVDKLRYMVNLLVEMTNTTNRQEHERLVWSDYAAMVAEEFE